MQFTAIKNFMGRVPYELIRYSDSATKEKLDHCGVFIPLPSELAKKFPSKKQDDSKPHITLFYIGDLDPERVDDVEAALSEALQWVKPFTVCMEDYGEFVNDDGLTIAHMKPRVRGSHLSFQDIHSTIREALDRAEVGYKHRPGPFKPHATLAYLKEGKVYKGAKPTGSFDVDSLELWLGDKIIKFPLRERSSSRFMNYADKGSEFSEVLYRYAEDKEPKKDARWVTMNGARVLIENGKPTKGPASIVNGSKGSSKEAAAPRSELEKAKDAGHWIEAMIRSGNKANFKIGGQNISVDRNDASGKERTLGDTREEAFKVFNEIQAKWGMGSKSNSFELTKDDGGFTPLGKAIPQNKSGFQLTESDGKFAPLGNALPSNKSGFQLEPDQAAASKQFAPMGNAVNKPQEPAQNTAPAPAPKTDHVSEFQSKALDMIKDWGLNKIGFDAKSVAASPAKQLAQSGFMAARQWHANRPAPQPKAPQSSQGGWVGGILDTFRAEFSQSMGDLKTSHFFGDRPALTYASDKNGRWVTIGSQEVEVNGEKRKEGGTPVFISSSGEILKGPSGMTGRNVSDLGKPEKKAKANIDSVKGAIDARGKKVKRENINREPSGPDWSRTRSGGYKMGPWTLDKVKGKKNWTISKNGVVMKDLGRRATFDHAEGFIVNNGGPQMEESAKEKKVSKWSKKRPSASPKTPPRGGLHSSPKPIIKDRGGLHKSPKPTEPKRNPPKEGFKPKPSAKGGLHKAPSTPVKKLQNEHFDFFRKALENAGKKNQPSMSVADFKANITQQLAEFRKPAPAPSPAAADPNDKTQREFRKRDEDLGSMVGSNVGVFAKFRKMRELRQRRA